MMIDPHPDLTDVDVDELVRQARIADVRLVRFMYCDNAGLIRGKSMHVDALAPYLRSGVSLPASMQALNLMDRPVSSLGLHELGDVRLVPDTSTFTVVPYAPHSAVMLADLMRVDGSPWEACPRSFLKRQIQEALGQGIQLQASFESEWVIGVRSGEDYLPFDESPALSGVGMATAGTVIDEVISALEAQRIRVEQYYPGVGHGQQEISLHHAHGLRAADLQVLFRETVRSVVYKQGFFASFAAKPWPGQPGNGCHLHLSAWDPTGEHNLFFDEHRQNGLSTLAGYFLAGIMEHLPGLLCLTCPSVNSYLRLQPGNRAPATITYGADNRETAIRLVSQLRGIERASTNLELRASDPSCNPYLALGAVLAAGLDGVRRELTPDPRLLISGDPSHLTDDERTERGIRQLPHSLPEAILALEADQVLLEALGATLSRSFLGVRRSEWDYFRDESTSSQYRAHFWKY